MEMRFVSSYCLFFLVASLRNTHLHHASKQQFHLFPSSIALSFVIDLLSWTCLFCLCKQSDLHSRTVNTFGGTFLLRTPPLATRNQQTKLNRAVAQVLIASLGDQLKIIVPLSQPIRLEVKSKRTMPQSCAFSRAWPPL